MMSVRRCVENGICFFVKPEVKVNGQYYWDILSPVYTIQPVVKQVVKRV